MRFCHWFIPKNPIQLNYNCRTDQNGKLTALNSYRKPWNISRLPVTKLLNISSPLYSRSWLHVVCLWSKSSYIFRTANQNKKWRWDSRSTSKIKVFYMFLFIKYTPSFFHWISNPLLARLNGLHWFFFKCKIKIKNESVYFMN